MNIVSKHFDFEGSVDEGLRLKVERDPNRVGWIIRQELRRLLDGSDGPAKGDPMVRAVENLRNAGFQVSFDPLELPEESVY